MVNPDCSHCVDEAKARAGELRDDDPVLAWTRGKYAGGAIPIRFVLNPYRVISDTYGVFVFDLDAGFARGYEPSLDFTFYGLMAKRNPRLSPVSHESLNVHRTFAAEIAALMQRMTMLSD